jgi:hypothetical protein
MDIPWSCSSGARVVCALRVGRFATPNAGSANVKQGVAVSHDRIHTLQPQGTGEFDVSHRDMSGEVAPTVQL